MKKQIKIVMCIVAVVLLTTILLIGCSYSKNETGSSLPTEEISENETSEQSDSTETTDNHVVGNRNTTEASSRTTNDTTATTEESERTNNQTASNSTQESRTTTNATTTTTETKNSATQQTTSNAGNTSTGNVTTTTAPTTASSNANHTHDYVAVYRKVYHEATTEQRLVTQAWDEPVKEGGYECNQCGQQFWGPDLLDSSTQTFIDYITHMSECQGVGSSCHNVERVVDYIHHDAVYETVTNEAWEENIFEYSECSICGDKRYDVVGRGAKYI